MERGCVIAFMIICVLCASVQVFAVENPLEKVLPAPACTPGWTIDEKVVLYNKDTLFDRIDGEAELYFPYGFEALASARYANTQNPKVAVDADVYKMGTLLDAFGMYANYRRKDDAAVAIGAEGTVSSSQLFFYQDRYLVRLQATGAANIQQDVFLACARAISQNLPRNTGKPKELEAFMIPAVVKKSERYIAQSLLGYDFFHRGVIADAIFEPEQMQVFIVLEGSQDAARKVFEQYRSYLKTSGKDMRVIELPGRLSLNAVDPLYGNVLVEQAGQYLIGAVRFKNISAAKRLAEELRIVLSQ